LESLLKSHTCLLLEELDYFYTNLSRSSFWQNELLICFDSNLGFEDDEPHPHVAGRSISFVARGYGAIEQNVTKGPPS
jgi:hypothetical protein